MYLLDRTDVNFAQLADELSDTLGTTVRVAARPPASENRDGTLIVIDDATDEETDRFDADMVADVIAAHTPPPRVDPDDELDAGLAEVAARDDVPEWGLAMIAKLRGQAGHQGRVAGRRPK